MFSDWFGTVELNSFECTASVTKSDGNIEILVIKKEFTWHVILKPKYDDMLVNRDFSSLSLYSYWKDTIQCNEIAPIPGKLFTDFS